MDLAFLIPSKVRRLVIAYFVEQPEAQVYVRQLARELKLSPQLVYRELVNLEGWGLLFSRSQGNQRVFSLNQKFFLYLPLQELFQKTKQAQSFKGEVVQTLNWNKLKKRYNKIKVPKNLLRGLQSQRQRPRSFDEEKILKKKNLL